jgi:two-component system KDP operon response regulator KdpE
MPTKSVLICDDDQILVSIVKVVLAKKNFTIFTANDGAAALKLIKSARPNLVFLDIDMPQKNGFEVLEDLKTGGFETIYKIVLSGREDKASRDRALSLGAHEVWVKPFNASRLLAAVDALIQQGKV